jgi:hypothetical protein
MYVRRLDLQAQPEAAAYCGVGPPLPLQADAETQVYFSGHMSTQYCRWPHVTHITSALQVATAVWHVCEQARSVCGPELGDIVIALRLGGACDQEPSLAVAVAAATPAIAMQALQQIVQLAVKLG